MLSEHEPVPRVDDVPAERAVGEARERDRVGDRVGAADPPGLAELGELVEHLLRDRRLRPEHVDPRPLVRRDRGARGRGDRVARDPQHRVARLGRPAGGRHREAGLLGRGDDDRRRRLARRRDLEPVDRLRERGVVGALDLASSCSPRRRRPSPTRITCAPPASFAPVGISRPSACSVAGGSSPRSENSSGARSGADISWAAETATRQSAVSTSVTARGRVSRSREGKTACATPAASAIGSAPPTRVVLRVANAGKPSSAAASSSSPSRPSTGACSCRRRPDRARRRRRRHRRSRRASRIRAHRVAGRSAVRTATTLAPGQDSRDTCDEKFAKWALVPGCVCRLT